MRHNRISFNLRLAIWFALLFVPLFAAVANNQAASPESRTAQYFESIRKTPPLLLAFLREMPKGGDLHNHLSGAIYAESLIQWATELQLCVDPKTYALSAAPCGGANATVPATTALGDPILYRSMIDAFSMRNWQLSGQSGHDHFFDAFDKFGAATHGNTGRMLAETANRAASQVEVYQELMTTPGSPELNAVIQKSGWNDNFAQLRDTMRANGMKDAVSAARQQMDAAEAVRNSTLHCAETKADPGCQVIQRYLFQVLRGLPKQIVFAQILCAFELASLDPRFVGLNLVMPEDYYIPMRDFSLHMRILDYMHTVYPRVHIALHAGELAPGLVPPEGLRFHVRDSVLIAHAERISHGVDVMNEADPLELQREMSRRDVMVEICLTSNDVILGVTGRQHPLHDYMRAGVPVALATDDEGVARSDMTQEYLKGAEEQDLSYLELKKMARTSLEHAFLPGASLWRDGKFTSKISDCAVYTGAKPSPKCQKFLEGSERARLQWKLEEQFRVFEAQPRPVAASKARVAAQ